MNITGMMLTARKPQRAFWCKYCGTLVAAPLPMQKETCGRQVCRMEKQRADRQKLREKTGK